MAKRSRRAARAVLARTSRRRRDGVAGWFEAHPGAREFVEVWLEMRRDGETDWSVRMLLNHLRSDLAYPYASETGLSHWLQVEFPELYASAIAR